MTTVTQADRDRADSFYAGLTLGHTGVRRLERILAAHREAAEKAGAKAMHAAISAELHKCGEPCPQCHDAIAALSPAQIAGGGK